MADTVTSLFFGFYHGFENLPEWVVEAYIALHQDPIFTAAYTVLKLQATPCDDLPEDMSKFEPRKLADSENKRLVAAAKRLSEQQQHALVSVYVDDATSKEFFDLCIKSAKSGCLFGK